MNNPRRGSLILAARLKDRIKLSEEGDWGEITRRIDEGMVIPVLGNAVRNELIFQPPVSDVPGPQAGTDTTNDVAGNTQVTQTVDEQLAELWAETVNYPLADKQSLARVAMFNRVSSKDSEHAKTKYLEFLKNALVLFAETDEKVAGVANELRDQVKELGFSKLVTELDYPHFPEGQEDPLRVLARFPLPIYITTSYYDFMERALEIEGRKPITQVCFWPGEVANVAPEHQTNPNLVPTVKNPLVYHLYGLEKYPSTLVLSEDDYLDFLLRISTDTDTTRPVIPLYLREALKARSLILLGYRLQDWDFRVLLRGMIKQSSLRPYSLVIQLRPEEQTTFINSEEARRYLEEYLRDTFTIEWCGTDCFIQQLWDKWNKWRQVQP